MAMEREGVREGEDVGEPCVYSPALRDSHKTDTQPSQPLINKTPWVAVYPEFFE